MPNMKGQIMAHNRRILSNNEEKINECATAESKNARLMENAGLKN